jgi:aryl-alcohol dehydrogenase-like predicted oxidoreductase
MVPMAKRRLGGSTLEVSVVGLGGNNFGGRIDFAASSRVVDKAIELGINLIDTADSYGDKGSSEEWLGRILGEKRKAIVLASKFGMPMDDAGKLKGASRGYIMHAVEASLKRLRTDWIDLYQLHRPDLQTPIEETLRALDDLVRQGKVRFLGCSNLSAQQVVEAQATARQHGLAAFVSCQDEYSLLVRDVERELIPTAKALGLGILPYFPLASGLLRCRRDRGWRRIHATRRSSSASATGASSANSRHSPHVAVTPCSSWRSVGCCAMAWSPASWPAPPRRNRWSRMCAPRGGRYRRRTWPRSIGSPSREAKATTQRGSPLRQPRYRPRFARFARMAASSTVLGSKSGSSHSIMPSW